MSPSSTNSTSGSSRTSGKRARNDGAHIQWQAARRPSSSPASASVNAPEQNPINRAPRACARRMASRTSGERGASVSGRFGTISVSAPSAASSPSTSARVKNPSRIRVRSVAAQSRKSYSSRPSSGLRSPKTSMAQLISKGLEFSSTIRTTRCAAVPGVSPRTGCEDPCGMCDF